MEVFQKSLGNNYVTSNIKIKINSNQDEDTLKTQLIEFARNNAPNRAEGIEFYDSYNLNTPRKRQRYCAFAITMPQKMLESFVSKLELMMQKNS